jgi:hypothetical protein
VRSPHSNADAHWLSNERTIEPKKERNVEPKKECINGLKKERLAEPKKERTVESKKQQIVVPEPETTQWTFEPSPARNWRLELIMEMIPGFTDRALAVAALKAHDDNVAEAIIALVDNECEEYLSQSSASTTGGSSVERDDSDDDEPILPKKRQDRRLSKTAVSTVKEEASNPRCALAVPISRTGMAKIEQHKIEPMQAKRIIDLTEDRDDDMEWRPTAYSKDEDTASSYSASTQDSSDRTVSSTSSTSIQNPATTDKRKLSQQKPAARRPSGRDRKEAKKLLQEQSAKERSQGHTTPQKSPEYTPVLETGKAHAPIVEHPFRTLYI